MITHNMQSAISRPKKIRLNSGCLKSKMGKVLLEENVMTKSCSEYIRKIYDSEKV